jgi:hypothetical protein
MAMQRDPPPFVWAVPDEKNILNCKYPSILIPSIFTHFRLYRALPRRTSSGQPGVAVVDNASSEGLRTVCMQAGNITA